RKSAPSNLVPVILERTNLTPANLPQRPPQRTSSIVKLAPVRLQSSHVAPVKWAFVKSTPESEQLMKVEPVRSAAKRLDSSRSQPKNVHSEKCTPVDLTSLRLTSPRIPKKVDRGNRLQRTSAF